MDRNWCNSDEDVCCGCVGIEGIDSRRFHAVTRRFAVQTESNLHPPPLDIAWAWLIPGEPLVAEEENSEAAFLQDFDVCQCVQDELLANCAQAYM